MEVSIEICSPDKSMGELNSRSTTLSNVAFEIATINDLKQMTYQSLCIAPERLIPKVNRVLGDDDVDQLTPFKGKDLKGEANLLVLLIQSLVRNSSAFHHSLLGKDTQTNGSAGHHVCATCAEFCCFIPPLFCQISKRGDSEIFK